MPLYVVILNTYVSIYIPYNNVKIMYVAPSGLPDLSFPAIESLRLAITCLWCVACKLCDRSVQNLILQIN